MNGINLFIKKYIIYILTVIKYRTYIFKIKSTSIKDSKQILPYKCCVVYKYFLG